MPKFRVQRNQNYTTMSNIHLKDKSLSLKAKGLLSMMLSLPDSWSYSIEGLIAICKEGETSVKSTLNELKKNKYLIVTRNRNKQGKFEYIYYIYEKPCVGFPPMDKPDVENQALLNTNNKKTKNKEKINKKKKTNYENYKQREYTEEELQGLYSNI